VLTPQSLAQTSSSATDPIGFVTMSISGTGGSGHAAYSFTTIGMLNPIAVESTTTSSGGSATLVDPNVTWADNQYNDAGGQITYFVEIVSGPGAGTTYDITATSAANHSLTLSSSLLSAITSGASYKIRKHWTVASVFGATNQGGLAGGNSITADQIQLFRNGGYVTYYYQTTGLGGVGWRKFGAPFIDASAGIIYPDDGMVIARNQSAGVSLVIHGAVKTGQTSIPVQSGYTLLGNVYAANMTIGSSNLYTGNPATGLAGGNSVTADQVLFWNGTGFATYYYQTSGFGGTGWRLFEAPTVDASATVIPVGAALFVNRSGAAFDWIAPQTPAGL
jgi:uncharacterized protein (TIGR02597 family)